MYLPPEHPLDPPRLRHQRSLECLTDLYRLIGEFEYGHEQGVLAHRDPQSGKWRPLGMNFSLAVPIPVTLRVSEMLYNLKVSLDYVMYAVFKLALYERRITQPVFDRLERRVQFPIKDTPEGFAGWCDRVEATAWILAHHLAIIEEAQPYRRPFMRLLGDLFHNLDKHRDLQPLVADFDLTGGSVDLIPWSGEGTESDRLNAQAEAAAKPVGMYRGGSVRVAFDDGPPVKETLEVLQSEVRALIDAFGS